MTDSVTDLEQLAAWLLALADDINAMPRDARYYVLHDAGARLEHQCQHALRGTGFDPHWLDRYADEIGWTSPEKRAERFREAAGYLSSTASPREQLAAARDLIEQVRRTLAERTGRQLPPAPLADEQIQAVTDILLGRPGEDR